MTIKIRKKSSFDTPIDSKHVTQTESRNTKGSQLKVGGISPVISNNIVQWHSGAIVMLCYGAVS